MRSVIQHPMRASSLRSECRLEKRYDSSHLRSHSFLRTDLSVLRFLQRFARSFADLAILRSRIARSRLAARTFCDFALDDLFRRRHAHSADDCAIGISARRLPPTDRSLICWGVDDGSK